MNSDMLIFTLCFGPDIAGEVLNEPSLVEGLWHSKKKINEFLRQCVFQASYHHSKKEFCNSLGLSEDKYEKFLELRPQQVLEENGSETFELAKPEKKCSCEYCGDQFNYSSKLKRHLIKHTGVYPHNCEVCGKGFFEKHLLRKHALIHEQKIEDVFS